jgi:membrane protease YdiL (CAAX protease family)
VHSAGALKYYAYYTDPTGKDLFSHPGISIIPYILCNPFFEELIVRAYVMTEIRELTGSALLAAAISVTIQSAYHLYYRWLGALSISFLFIGFAVYYALTRRALPNIVAHGIFDICALVRMW